MQSRHGGLTHFDTTQQLHPLLFVTLSHPQIVTSKLNSRSEEESHVTFMTDIHSHETK